MKTFKVDLDNNHIIINPGKTNEINITKSNKECYYCRYDKDSCGHFEGYQQYCDWFTAKNEYIEVD